MALVRWDPVHELASMEVDRLNRMFSDWYGGGSVAREWLPPVDIYVDDGHAVVIEADLPGMTREDIHVTCENDVLTLSGERKAVNGAARGSYQRRERASGSFTRSFTIPSTIDASKISAAYRDGVLTIRLPQREEAKPKQIAITA